MNENNPLNNLKQPMYNIDDNINGNNKTINFRQYSFNSFLLLDVWKPPVIAIISTDILIASSQHLISVATTIAIIGIIISAQKPNPFKPKLRYKNPIKTPETTPVNVGINIMQGIPNAHKPNKNVKNGTTEIIKTDSIKKSKTALFEFSVR